jgi:hypothetical protein
MMYALQSRSPIHTVVYSYSYSRFPARQEPQRQSRRRFLARRQRERKLDAVDIISESFRKATMSHKEIVCQGYRSICAAWASRLPSDPNSLSSVRVIHCSPLCVMNTLVYSARVPATLYCSA